MNTEEKQEVINLARFSKCTYFSQEKRWSAFFNAKNHYPYNDSRAVDNGRHIFKSIRRWTSRQAAQTRTEATEERVSCWGQSTGIKVPSFQHNEGSFLSNENDSTPVGILNRDILGMISLLAVQKFLQDKSMLGSCACTFIDLLIYFTDHEYGFYSNRN